MYRLRRGRPRSISPPAAGAATLDPTAQRILIVEDSDCLRAVAVRTLSDRGYAVAEARHGEDALRVIELTAEPFDLVVTEMMMPVMSGYKLGRRLARQRPALPVLYMSAAGNENLVRYGPPSGRTQVLRKPFLPDDLVRQVNESLTPTLIRSPAIPKVGSEGACEGRTPGFEEVREMTEPARRQLENELARLRRLRDTTLAILHREELDGERKLQAIERAFQDEPEFQGERDVDEEAEEARDRERLS